MNYVAFGNSNFEVVLSPRFLLVFLLREKGLALLLALGARDFEGQANVPIRELFRPAAF